MKYIKPWYVLLLFLAVLTSCKNEDEELNTFGEDCIFEQINDNRDGLIDENERMIMNECLENRLNSKNSIEKNLIGEWELIGYGHGWVSTYSQPCAYIKISKNELTFKFKNGYIDTVSTQPWNIEDVNNGQYFRLNIIPEYIEGLFINQFCSSYMYGDGTPSDGNMYLYRKVK